ncbi:calcium-transporting P-type ATPase, PMR1-type [Candidatus Woesearchaeota archaeon]|nr:calcium-transporting P-type ATPase, PMR1-type [Candidatus Woesearchaeota archaeon]
MYYQPLKEVLDELNTSEKGLSSSEAKRRLEKYGPNILEEKEKISPLKIFLSQFSSAIVWILIAAIVISLFIGEAVDATVIGIILVLNSIMGFIQEYKAERAIEALKKMVSLKAFVLRDGKEIEIDAEKLVPGDIIILETGEKIPADSRLIEIANLQTQEAALTGESMPVKKILSILKKGISIGDRKNMVFSGTIITNGRGKAVVAKTGMDTEIGRIAHLIQTAEAIKTPLQKKLAVLAKWLGIITIVIAAIVFLSGVLKGEPILEFLLVAVSLAVAAIPEGLPAVVTISLALGVKRMIKRNALVRKLPSVETLGCTTVICTDKTGTLTHNEMTVKKIFVDSQVVDVGGSGYEPIGHFSKHTKNMDLLLKIGVLCNDSKLTKEKTWQVIGDPTEGALVVSAAKFGMSREKLEKENPRIGEIPFDSKNKRMTTINEVKGKRVAYVKGAPDVLLDLCQNIVINSQVKKLTPAMKKKILEKNEEFADSELRVLGFAYKELKHEKREEQIEKDLTFVGLQGMIDPPREEVKESIRKCEKAGIKVVMITGDFRGTAVAIAKELGIKGKAITGEDINKIDLDKEVENIAIYARVNPEHKVKIVDALKKKGNIVAMTGDGFNDAPALKKADIGVSMGITGTDVAKEASEMILTDDNFSSIVNAVEEGRSIFDNIQKFLAYLLSGNVGEILVIFLAILIGLPLPLIAIHILWINLITDGLPALALGVEPPEKGIMDRPPRSPKGSVFQGLNAFVIYYPIIMFIGVMAIFTQTLNTGGIIKAQTMAFTSIMMFEAFQTFACKSITKPTFRVGILNNKWLIGAVASSILLQAAILYIPFFQNIFKVVPLGLFEWLIIVLVASTGFIYLELHKFRLTAKLRKK